MSVILLIDDEQEMARLVGMSLDDFDVRVVPAPDLAGALEAAREEAPALVLLDIALGAEDGIDILPRLRQEPALSEVPVVVFSVHDSRREEALSAGAQGFLPKPFLVDELRAAVEPYLQPRR